MKIIKEIVLQFRLMFCSVYKIKFSSNDGIYVRYSYLRGYKWEVVQMAYIERDAIASEPDEKLFGRKWSVVDITRI